MASERADKGYQERNADINKKYADPRRTRIIEDVSEAEINSDIWYMLRSVVTLTHNGYKESLPSRNLSSRDVESVETQEMIM